MGLTFRKTLNAGLFRFSFSKSGVGVSFGFGGFRYGLGPKGNYISVNKGIFHFRKFLSSSNRSTANNIQHVNMTTVHHLEPACNIFRGNALALPESFCET